MHEFIPILLTMDCFRLAHSLVPGAGPASGAPTLHGSFAQDIQSKAASQKESSARVQISGGERIRNWYLSGAS